MAYLFIGWHWRAFVPCVSSPSPHDGCWLVGCGCTTFLIGDQQIWAIHLTNRMYKALFQREKHIVSPTWYFCFYPSQGWGNCNWNADGLEMVITTEPLFGNPVRLLEADFLPTLQVQQIVLNLCCNKLLYLHMIALWHHCSFEKNCMKCSNLLIDQLIDLYAFIDILKWQEWIVPCIISTSWMLYVFFGVVLIERKVISDIQFMAPLTMALAGTGKWKVSTCLTSVLHMRLLVEVDLCF